MNSKDYNHQKLVKWREESGKTQEKIAQILSIDRNTVSRAETGRIASFELLAALCRIYGKSLHELIYDEPAVTAV